MNSQVLRTTLKQAQVLFRRNIGISAPALQKSSDPIQQLFLDKIREYKSKSSGDEKLVEPSEEILKELQQELNRATRQYGGAAGEDMTKFPTFKFPDVTLDPINMEE